MRLRRKRLYRVVGLFSEGLSPQYEKSRDFQSKTAAERYARNLLSRSDAIHVTIQVSDPVTFTAWPERFLPKETS